MSDRIPCAFCPRDFKTLGLLGDHVQRDHPDASISEVIAAIQSSAQADESGAASPNPPNGEWEQHGWFSGEEEEEMLPKADSTGSSGGSSGRKKSVMTYLDPDKHLNKVPKLATILAVRLDEENQYGIRVLLKLDMENRILFFGVNIKKSPNYEILTDRFGHDENDWADKKIKLHLEQDSFTGIWHPKVTFPEDGEQEQHQEEAATSATKKRGK